MSRRLLPNSTQIPDLILDEWMPGLTGAEVKTTLFIARKTYGWGKPSDALSIRQIARGTGLGIRTVNEVLHGTERRQGLIAAGMVHQTPSNLPNGHPRAWSTFSLNLGADCPEADDEKRASHAKTTQVQEHDRCENCRGQKVRPMRNMQSRHGEIAEVQGSNLCEKRIEQETKRHSLQETAAVVESHDATSAPRLPSDPCTLLDLTESQILAIAKSEPGQFVRQFRRECGSSLNPYGMSYAELMKRKGANSRSPNLVVAKCIIEDWLPELRDQRSLTTLPNTSPTLQDPSAEDPNLREFLAAKRQAGVTIPIDAASAAGETIR